jgi:hypothetical protein
MIPITIEFSITTQITIGDSDNSKTDSGGRMFACFIMTSDTKTNF